MAGVDNFELAFDKMQGHNLILGFFKIVTIKVQEYLDKEYTGDKKVARLANAKAQLIFRAIANRGVRPTTTRHRQFNKRASRQNGWSLGDHSGQTGTSRPRK